MKIILIGNEFQDRWQPYKITTLNHSGEEKPFKLPKLHTSVTTDGNWKYNFFFFGVFSTITFITSSHRLMSKQDFLLSVVRRKTTPKQETSDFRLLFVAHEPLLKFPIEKQWHWIYYSWLHRVLKWPKNNKYGGPFFAWQQLHSFWHCIFQSLMTTMHA